MRDDENYGTNGFAFIGRVYFLLFNALRVFLSMSAPDGLSVSGVRLRKILSK